MSEIKPIKTDAQKKKEMDKKAQDKKAQDSKKLEAEKKRITKLEAKKQPESGKSDKIRPAQTNASIEDKSISRDKSLDKKPHQETQEQRAARKQAEYQGGLPLDGASGPPDLSKNIHKIIPAEQPVIKDLTPPGGKSPEKIEQSPVKLEPQRVDRRRLTPEQEIRRQTIAQPHDGVGCPFNGLPPKSETKRFMDGRSKEQLERLAYTKSEIMVTAFCSSPGSEQYNRELAEGRANKVIDDLVTDYGVDRSRFTIHVVGDVASDVLSPGEDRPEDRVVMIDITDINQPIVEGPDKLDPKAVQSISDLPNNHPQKADLEVGNHPKDRAFEVGKDRVGFHNNETGKTVLIETKNIPEGHTKINNTWVYRNGNNLETKPRLPTTPETVKNQLREEKRDRKSRSLFPVTEVSSAEILNRLSLNMKTNQAIDRHLTSNQSLETALQKVHQEGVNQLRQSISNIATGAYMEKFLLGTLSKHNL